MPLYHRNLVATRSTPAPTAISQNPLQSTFPQSAASTERTADVSLQILVQAAALPQREAGRWRGMNSFVGNERKAKEGESKELID